jgi:signal transduction histidine kinase/CheY-like chemotaxis protein
MPYIYDMKKLVVLILIIIASNTSKARNHSDSLWNIWNDTTEKPSDRIIAIDNIIFNNYLFIKPDSAFVLAKWMYDLAVENNLEKNIGVALMLMGGSYYFRSEYDSALMYDNLALNHFIDIDEQGGQASALGNMANILTDQGNYQKGIEYYHRSLKLHESLGNKRGQAIQLMNIGLIYMGQSEYDKALEYINSSLSINELIDYKYGIADCLNNLGSLYRSLGDLAKSQEALKKCLKIYEIIDDGQGKAILYNSIGNTYALSKDYAKAMEYFDLALVIQQQMGDKKYEAKTLIEKGNLYFKLNELVKSNSNLESGLKIAEKIGAIHQIRDASKSLYKNYKSMGQSQRSLSMLEQYNLIRDSISNEENERSLIRQEYKYDYEKQALTDSIYAADQDRIVAEAHRNEIIKKDKTRNFLVIAGLIIVLLSISIWSRMRFTKRSNRALKIAKQKAEQSEAFKQQFLANMSHEIRTPMNAVMGMTNLVLDTELKDKQRSYLTMVKKSSDNLLHIINDILDLSKIEAGKMELEEIDFSLTDTIDQVRNTLLYKTEEKGLELLVKVDEDLPNIILGDPVRLNQVLINLAGNAIKFTDEGSVLIELKNEAGIVRFNIIDTGIGIPGEKLKSIFDNFSQANTSDTRKYGGTGLGLSISQQLVSMMGGSIAIESELGCGSNFYFDLEFKEGDITRYEERIAEEESVDGSILDGLNILVADDNEFNRIVASDTLQSKAKIKIIEAKNGKEAIDKLDESIDLILMDAQMPIMSGFDASINIRKLENEKLNKVPIIALTASVLRTDLDRCFDAGMNGYIPKPFKAHELIIGIANALNIRVKLGKKVDVKKDGPY